jgi:Uma2 family endonuclease
MSTVAATTPVPALLTAEEYLRVAPPDVPTELVDGEIVEMPPPGVYHGEVCLTVGALLRAFVKAKGIGRVVSNDAGVITQRGPDTVRGADVAYYSYQRLPADQRPKGYSAVRPELVVEVKSPTDRWSDLLRKAAEYLDAGVVVVVLVDPDLQQVQIYRADQPVRLLSADDHWEMPDLLPGFSAAVSDLFA